MKMKNIGPGNSKFYFVDLPLNNGSVRQVDQHYPRLCWLFRVIELEIPEIWDRMSSIFIGIHSSTLLWVQSLDTLGPAYNEFGYNQHPAVTSRFFFYIN